MHIDMQAVLLLMHGMVAGVPSPFVREPQTFKKYLKDFECFKRSFRKSARSFIFFLKILDFLKIFLKDSKALKYL